VSFKFNTRGGDLFYDVTNQNRPDKRGGQDQFYRHLAIILDNEVMSAPRLITAIQTDGQITGNFTSKEVNQLVSILRAGALPATLKPLPVSENTIGPTLGEDTIRSGTFSVGVAFAVVLAFMIVYYRFAGFVACVALLANLLLTVGFMVLVNATFTLPGLAGLVLMLGMAVDANVLIYERLREERDRGASLALAIRNGYDRAFPTIIDTHLTSIFTAIVLYVVGNDQLKGFGISLTVGLIISLFTSLYMTRLLFDIWLAKGWLHKLSMFRLLSRTNIDFMSIRYAMFALTVFVSLAGITLFLVRGKAGLNIDFVGGTAYTGQLNEAMTITDLRNLLKEDRQGVVLSVRDVKQTDSEGHSFLVTYQQGDKGQVSLATAATPEQVKERAQTLPDSSVEQIFRPNEPSEGNRSRYFTVRTSEKEADLVMVTLSRLLRQDDTSLLKQTTLDYDTKGKEPTLTFSDFASPGRVQDLLVRTFHAMGIDEPQPVDVRGVGENQQGSYKQMRLVLTQTAAAKMDPAKLNQALAELKREFGNRPQPLRLENFDSQLALETQTRALYAILASWGAILLYLWFRFGSWTFGLAAVLCLVHDLFFTLGVIAFSHYIHHWFPSVAHVLLLQDFKIDLPAVAALLTLVGYSVSDTIVVFDRIREVRGKNPELTPQMINDSVNQTLSRTLLTAFSVWLVVTVLYIFGGEGVHLFAFVMVAGVLVGTYSSIYIASPLLLIFGEGRKPSSIRERRPQPQPEGAPA
jgi:SecD/SecF fusion protein